MEYLLEYSLATILLLLLFLIALLFVAVRYLRELVTLIRKWNEVPEVEMHFRHGKFDDVIERCKAHIEKSPTHTKAHWHLARAYYGKQMWNEAKHEMEVVAQLEPSWQSEFTQPYIDEIEKHLNSGTTG